jgi:hypothetical protein
MAAQPTEPTESQTVVDEWRSLSYDERHERMHNAASFTDIPRAQCPWENVRLALELRALSGHDCYAYRPTHQPDYVIWDRQPDPATEARFSPADWAIRNGFEIDCKEGA